MEMEFLHEILFLKAYYWAMLGKYAFTVQDRIDWTDQARRIFDHLCIPQDIYCNPDPSAQLPTERPVTGSDVSTAIA